MLAPFLKHIGVHSQSPHILPSRPTGSTTRPFFSYNSFAFHLLCTLARRSSNYFHLAGEAKCHQSSRFFLTSPMKHTGQRSLLASWILPVVRLAIAGSRSQRHGFPTSKELKRQYLSPFRRGSQVLSSSILQSKDLAAFLTAGLS